MYKLTDQEGQRLTAMMVAARPDWTPNKPGLILKEANETDGLPGRDFGHCIRALAHYATQTDPAGGWAKRTPNFYPQDGKHWAATAPDDWQAPRARVFCLDHPTFDASTCTACWGDIKAGIRPENLLGKHHNPESEQDQ